MPWNLAGKSISAGPSTSCELHHSLGRSQFSCSFSLPVFRSRPKGLIHCRRCEAVFGSAFQQSAIPVAQVGVQLHILGRMPEPALPGHGIILLSKLLVICDATHSQAWYLRLQFSQRSVMAALSQVTRTPDPVSTDQRAQRWTPLMAQLKAKPHGTRTNATNIPAAFRGVPIEFANRAATFGDTRCPPRVGRSLKLSACGRRGINRPFLPG